MEQLIGRTHRDGQYSDEVTVELLMLCRENVEAFAQSVKDAHYVDETWGTPQKLLLADIDVLSVEKLRGSKELRFKH